IPAFLFLVLTFDGAGNWCFEYKISNSLQKSSTFTKVSVILSRSIGVFFMFFWTTKLTLPMLLII
ncbi:MAG: hypothetical protein AN485_23435, partial [Anabaena sp. MDT14b]